MDSDFLHIVASFAFGSLDLFCKTAGAGLAGVNFAEFSNEMFRAFSDRFGVNSLSVSSPHLSGGIWFCDVSTSYKPASLPIIRASFRVFLTSN